MLRKLRTWLVAGLAVLLPVWLTYVTLKWLFEVIDRALAGLLVPILGRHIPGAGVAVSMLLILFVGWLASHLIGQRMISFGDDILLRLPVVRAVYGVVKQVTNAVFGSTQQAFTKVALVEFPHAGSYSVGFVTGELGDFISVWVPPTPNPAAGFLLIIPRGKVRILGLTVEEGLKYVVSTGVFLPGQAKLEQMIADVAEFHHKLRLETGVEATGGPAGNGPATD